MPGLFIAHPSEREEAHKLLSHAHTSASRTEEQDPMLVTRDRNQSRSGEKPRKDNSTGTLNVVVEKWETITEAIKVGECTVTREILSPVNEIIYRNGKSEQYERTSNCTRTLG
jgi:predicted kinase